MALVTLGTNANNTLTAQVFNPQAPIADFAQVAANIKGQSLTAFHGISPGAWSPSGRLHLPGGRGVVLVKPGDYIAYDSWGWPIVVSKESIAAGGTSWTHT